MKSDAMKTFVRVDQPPVFEIAIGNGEVLRLSGVSEKQAVLLASAHDLLVALREIVQAEWTAVSLQDMTPQHRGRLERARVVIARAEGKS